MVTKVQLHCWVWEVVVQDFSFRGFARVYQVLDLGWARPRAAWGLDFGG